MKTSQLVFSVNQLSGVDILETLFLNVLKEDAGFLGDLLYFYFSFSVSWYNCLIKKACLEPSRTSMMELFCENS